MNTDRADTVKRILAVEKHVYRWVQLGGVPSWAETDLTMPQLKVLILVDRSTPMPTSQVARTLGMTLSTTTGVIDRLVSQGLIQRLEDPSDRRVVLLRATHEGRELTDRLMRGGRLRLKEILNQLNDEELQVVDHALELLGKATAALGGALPDDSPVEPAASEEAAAAEPASNKRR